MSGADAGPCIVLIGPMAAGKSSIGRRLAALLEVPFADLDDLVVERDGREIPDIFAADGEESFRALEAQVLTEALRTHRGVLSLGGGAPMTASVQPLLRQAPVALLEIGPETAARRIGTGTGRPMLRGEDPLQRWSRLAEERTPTYRALARWRIDADRGSVTGLARRLAELIRTPTSTSSGKDRA